MYTNVDVHPYKHVSYITVHMTIMLYYNYIHQYFYLAVIYSFNQNLINSWIYWNIHSQTDNLLLSQHRQLSWYLCDVYTLYIHAVNSSQFTAVSWHFRWQSGVENWHPNCQLTVYSWIDTSIELIMMYVPLTHI